MGRVVGPVVIGPVGRMVVIGPVGRVVGRRVVMGGRKVTVMFFVGSSPPCSSSYSTGCSKVRSSEYTKGVGMVVARDVIPSKVFCVEPLNVGKGVIPGNKVLVVVATSVYRPTVFMACSILSLECVYWSVETEAEAEAAVEAAKGLDVDVGKVDVRVG